MIQHNNSPTVIEQTLVKAPLDEVFQILCQPKGARILWRAQASAPLQKNERTSIKWTVSGYSLQIRTAKLIPNKLISTIWQDTFTTLDFEFDALADELTLVTIKAYDFKENGADLFRALTDKRSMLKSALKNLVHYFSTQKRPEAFFISQPDQVKHHKLYEA